ncbi:MAG: hypothetical protein AAGN66_14485, partial [Acidobacteriota bacterium]
LARPLVFWALMVALLLTPLVAHGDPSGESEGKGKPPWELQVHELVPTQAAVPPPPPPAEFPVQLILDDDTAEGAVGFNGTFAQQFLWLSVFDGPGEAFDLEQIWVLFPAGANMAVGEAAQLAVYADGDADPTNGASLLGTFEVAIQAVDGDTFSIYELDPPLPIPEDAGSVLLGVVDRWVESGVTSPTLPAALDTTASEGRSYAAVWLGDPPDPPILPADDLNVPVDGNWMLRGFGTPTPVPVIEVPVLGTTGFGLLTLALAAAAIVALRRRVTGPVGS